ncbi:sensor histidine kinase [Phytoactinopolyspora halotolerans]|uniref:Oxygen sensor histidine kinase NreB n=1 Tax=Phytoactinopolyspora halotolerans TaxID=1981512 RepID=A0A6L9S4U7_9ACTN|nr:sensor histidine kinase [Phytoactinopolyspora halotolerans]NED99653.1 sensor histidine kinase [Phytoactinopolyspora halotolerans]
MSSEQVREKCTPDWDRWWGRVLFYIPWVLLAPPTVISQLPTDQTWSERAVTLGLVAVAAGWVFFGNTRVPQARRDRGYLSMVYFAGLLVLFVALMSRDLVFVLFTITGFFHAYLLKPWPRGVAAIFGTSVVLNTMTMGPPEASAEWIGTYVGVIAIQTGAIGLGIVFSEKGAEHDRKRDELVTKLEAALEENAGLHAQLLTQAREAGVLDERQRMAGEIHDTLAQGLTGIVTQVQAAQQVWDRPDQARPHLDRALNLARESLTEARRSVQALRPQELDEAHLPDALGDLAKRWAEDTDVAMHVDVTGDRVPLSPAIEVAIFRVAQEALTNVAKHANASRVGLTLSYLGDVVLLDVRDDGTGMPSGDSRGFGLNSMTHRIRSVGGTLEIESAPGDGTAISASVPAITVSEWNGATP